MVCLDQNSGVSIMITEYYGYDYLFDSLFHRSPVVDELYSLASLIY